MSERLSAHKKRWLEARRRPNTPGVWLERAGFFTLGNLFGTATLLTLALISTQEQEAYQIEQPTPIVSPFPFPERTPEIVITDPNIERIQNIRTLQKEAVRNGSIVMFMPESVLAVGGKVEEIGGNEKDEKGNEYYRSYFLSVKFPARQLDSLFHFPAIAEGKVTRVEEHSGEKSGFSFEIEMGDQIWNFSVDNNGGSYLIVKDGEEVRLGEPLIAVNQKGYLHPSPTSGTKEFTSDRVTVRARFKGTQEDANYLRKEDIVKDSFSGNYLTIPTVEVRPKRLSA